MKVDSSPALIGIRDLVVSFSRWGQMVTAIQNVSLDFFPGAWVLLAGHNGAGKSTLLKAIAGQLRPISGYVMINGQRVADLNPFARSNLLFTVHQDPLLGSA